jgi:hypothetical protein
MSLLNNQPPQEDKPREELTPPSEVRAMVKAEISAKQKAIQKAHRDRYMANWQQEKAQIDNLGKAELKKYLKATQDKAADPRVGLHSMKINPHELALIRLCLEITGAKSSRELFIKFCKQAVKGK